MNWKTPVRRDVIARCQKAEGCHIISLEIYEDLANILWRKP